MPSKDRSEITYEYTPPIVGLDGKYTPYIMRCIGKQAPLTVGKDFKYMHPTVGCEEK